MDTYFAPMTKACPVPKSERHNEFREALTLKCEQECARKGLTLLYHLRSPAIPGHGPTYKAVASDGEHPPVELPLSAENSKALREMELYVTSGEETAAVRELISEIRSVRGNSLALPMARAAKTLSAAQR